MPCDTLKLACYYLILEVSSFLAHPLLSSYTVAVHEIKKINLEWGWIKVGQETHLATCIDLGKEGGSFCTAFLVDVCWIYAQQIISRIVITEWSLYRQLSPESV